MTPSSNTLTPTWRTARSRVPPPPTGCFPALSHHPQALTHFECCMNLVGGPCPSRPPDTSTSYRVNVCAIFPGPGTTQPWVFPGGQSRLSPAPSLPRGDGDPGWDREGGPYPASPSAFLFSNTVGSQEMASGWAWGRGRVSKDSRSSLSPSPDIHLSQAVLCPRNTA